MLRVVHVDDGTAIFLELGRLVEDLRSADSRREVLGTPAHFKDVLVGGQGPEALGSRAFLGRSQRNEHPRPVTAQACEGRVPFGRRLLPPGRSCNGVDAISSVSIMGTASDRYAGFILALVSRFGNRAELHVQSFLLHAIRT